MYKAIPEFAVGMALALSILFIMLASQGVFDRAPGSKEWIEKNKCVLVRESFQLRVMHPDRPSELKSLAPYVERVYNCDGDVNRSVRVKIE